MKSVSPPPRALGKHSCPAPQHPEGTVPYVFSPVCAPAAGTALAFRVSSVSSCPTVLKQFSPLGFLGLH